MPGRLGHEPTIRALHERIEELEAQVEQLREAATGREHVGFACGVLAERYRLSPEAAWLLVRRVSQNTNTRAKDVARLVRADLDGGVTSQDASLALLLNAQVPDVRPLITEVPPCPSTPSS